MLSLSRLFCPYKFIVKDAIIYTTLKDMNNKNLIYFYIGNYGSSERLHSNTIR